MSKEIVKRVFYALDIVLASPMNTSAGDSEMTDKDLLQNGLGEYFIPGTSIAGALRERMDQEVRKELAGYSEGEKGRMSSLFFSDLYLKKGTKSIRHGVQLDEGKIVKNKFDMEVLETGAKGTLFLHYIQRNGEQDYEDLIRKLITDIQAGYIRFGANKTRGYGRIQVNCIHRSEFDREKVEQYLAFDAKNTGEYEEHMDYLKWQALVPEKSEDFVRILVPLMLTGGISIRKYSTVPNEADYEQITISMKDEKGIPKAVIPGSSWDGAIRSGVLSALKELGDTRAQEHVDQWFGYVDIKKKSGGEGGKRNTAQSSLVVFGESILEGAKPLTMTRNKINRFDASTQDGALYTEKSYFEGRTVLEILVKKDVERQYEALIGALQIAISDIQNGYTAIGGQTAVGRGVFAADETRKVTYENGQAEIFGKALFTFLEGR